MPGKLLKSMVAYNETAPPPFIFQYECRFCTFFRPPAQCATVEGDIKPVAWCLLYFPVSTELPLLWLVRGAAAC